MKKALKFILIGAAFSLLLPVAGSAEQAGRGDLTVTATGFRNAKGKAMFGLYGDAAKFLKTPGKGQIVSISGNKATVIFRGVPFGTYAVAVYHDENGNGKMDTNLVGIPKEGSGVSNNPKPRMGPPLWKAAKFQLNAAKVSQSVKVVYF